MSALTDGMFTVKQLVLDPVFKIGKLYIEPRKSITVIRFEHPVYGSIDFQLPKTSVEGIIDGLTKAIKGDTNAHNA